MTPDDIKTARAARLARIEQNLRAWQSAHQGDPVNSVENSTAYSLMPPGQRAAVAATENARTIPKSCCGH